MNQYLPPCCQAQPHAPACPVAVAARELAKRYLPTPKGKPEEQGELTA